ncbi:unnamed protein product [Cyprideis torosa]|uniref:Uncharacterized protein n=1 Tax=Cyprideis torosa TaxID=163714 RepID=A0A7R8WC79_9CRUS|nr:unnamed protein product [Cyprideis torosa]CAG0890392.1 unnamed protein product [Cyprideis torosa]
MMGHVQVLRWLCESASMTSCLSERNRTGYTPLELAVKHGRSKCASWILEHWRSLGHSDLPGSSAETGPPSRETLLHLAARYGQAEVIAPVAAFFSEVDQRDARGMTPLHVAAQGAQLDCVRALVKAGCDPGTKTRDSGETPLDLALASCGSGDAGVAVAEYLTLLRLSLEGLTTPEAPPDPEGRAPEQTPGLSLQLRDAFRDVLTISRRMDAEREDLMGQLKRLHEHVIGIHDRLIMELQVLLQENRSLRQKLDTTAEDDLTSSSESDVREVMEMCSVLHEDWKREERTWANSPHGKELSHKMAVAMALWRKAFPHARPALPGSPREQRLWATQDEGAAASFPTGLSTTSALEAVRSHLNSLSERCPVRRSSPGNHGMSPLSDSEEDALGVNSADDEERQSGYWTDGPFVVRRKKKSPSSPDGRAVNHHRGGWCTDFEDESLHIPVAPPPMTSTPLSTQGAKGKQRRSPDEGGNGHKRGVSKELAKKKKKKERDYLSSSLQPLSLTSENGTISVVAVIEPMSSSSPSDVSPSEPQPMTQGVTHFRSASQPTTMTPDPRPHDSRASLDDSSVSLKPRPPPTEVNFKDHPPPSLRRSAPPPPPPPATAADPLAPSTPPTSPASSTPGRIRSLVQHFEGSLASPPDILQGTLHLESNGAADDSRAKANGGPKSLPSRPTEKPSPSHWSNVQVFPVELASSSVPLVNGGGLFAKKLRHGGSDTHSVSSYSPIVFGNETSGLLKKLGLVKGSNRWSSSSSKKRRSSSGGPFSSSALQHSKSAPSKQLITAIDFEETYLTRKDLGTASDLYASFSSAPPQQREEEGDSGTEKDLDEGGPEDRERRHGRRRLRRFAKSTPDLKASTEGQNAGLDHRGHATGEALSITTSEDSGCSIRPASAASGSKNSQVHPMSSSSSLSSPREVPSRAMEDNRGKRRTRSGHLEHVKDSVDKETCDSGNSLSPRPSLPARLPNSQASSSGFKPPKVQTPSMRPPLPSTTSVAPSSLPSGGSTPAGGSGNVDLSAAGPRKTTMLKITIMEDSKPEKKSKEEAKLKRSRLEKPWYELSDDEGSGEVEQPEDISHLIEEAGHESDSEGGAEIV